MRTANAVGGVCGIVSAVVLVPAFLVGYPDAPQTAAEADTYFDDNSRFILWNGIVPLVQVPTFLVFLAVVVAVLFRADRDEEVVPRLALAGGVFYLALSALGKVAEVAYPATIVRFEEAALDPQLKRLLLSTASWCYHVGQLGVAVLAVAVAVVAWRTAALPRWIVPAGGALAVLAAVHVWLPLPAAIATLVWVVAASVALLMVPATR